MANRVINTGVWKDSYIVDLEHDEKLLFLYLLTNHMTNIAGIYELSVREMSFDTGIDKKRIEEILQKFIRDKKIQYLNGWVALNNWIKHQTTNPKVAIGIERIVDNLPDWLQIELLFDTESQQSSLLNDSLHIDYDSLKTVENMLKSGKKYSLSKPIALNLTKLNLTKLNANIANGSSEEHSKSQKPSGAQYRKAVEADQELQGRAKRSYTRKPSLPGKISPDEIDKAYDRRTMKR